MFLLFVRQLLLLNVYLRLQVISLLLLTIFVPQVKLNLVLQILQLLTQPLVLVLHFFKLGLIFQILHGKDVKVRWIFIGDLPRV